MSTPVQVVAQLRAVPQGVTATEEPLSAQEVATLKIHFRFLRDQRNVLKLRVNAAEDLLLNGVKEPTHRGLCQHLLAKVERSRVLSVSQTLPPNEATRLLAGVIRFAPEIGYVLRYLECVKVTATQEQAGAAVTEALKQIDFSTLSAAQMRQLVALIVDVFAVRDLPLFLFTLLKDQSFKLALDRSLDGFPEVLSRMVRPLRALYGRIVSTHQRSPQLRDQVPEPPGDADAIHAGVELLLAVHPASLLGLPESVRRRLYLLGCATLATRTAARAETLLQLLQSLGFAQPAERSNAAITLVSALLSAGEDATARKVIEHSTDANDGGSLLHQWRQALDAPRVGTVAIDGARSRSELPGPGRLYRGWHIPTQRSVLVRYGNVGEAATYAELISILRQVLVPGLARVVAAGTEIAQRPYIAVELHGQPLSRLVRQNVRREKHTQIRWAVEICAILNALAHQGLALPDAELVRFNADPDGKVWLVDLWQMRLAEPQTALMAHCQLARHCCRQLWSRDEPADCSTSRFERMDSAANLVELARVTETL